MGPGFRAVLQKIIADHGGRVTWKGE
jgi:hypothetical protein